MRKVWLAVPFVLFIVTGVSAYTWWQSPAVTTGDHGSQKVSSVLASDTALKPWQTSYFTTSIPSTMRVKVSTDTNDYGSYLLTSASARVSDQVGVTVASLGNNSLNEIGAVKLRLNQPELYSASTLASAPEGAYVFSSDSGYEKSVFWQQGGSYAAVVASGTAARRADLDQALQVVVSNWQWQ